MVFKKHCQVSRRAHQFVEHKYSIDIEQSSIFRDLNQFLLARKFVLFGLAFDYGSPLPTNRRHAV